MASVNPRVSTAFIIIIIKVSERQSNRRTQTPHFLLCAIINHHAPFFFLFPPSLLKHQLKSSYKNNKKNRKSHAYLISFSNGLHKGSCHLLGHLLERKVSIKSESAGRETERERERRKIKQYETFQSEKLSKLQPDFKMEGCLSSRAGKVLFYSFSHRLDENQDRSTRTLSAEVTLR